MSIYSLLPLSPILYLMPGKTEKENRLLKMSLNSFKESLKPCSQSSISSSNTSSNFEFSTSQNPNFSRKPPKSSLSQQLKRLDFPSFDEIRSQNPNKTLPVVTEEEEKEEGEDGDEKSNGFSIVSEFSREKLSTQSFDLGTKGPFEPLVLSSPGESPIVQVISSSLSFLALDFSKEADA